MPAPRLLGSILAFADGVGGRARFVLLSLAKSFLSFGSMFGYKGRRVHLIASGLSPAPRSELGGIQRYGWLCDQSQLQPGSLGVVDMSFIYGKGNVNFSGLNEGGCRSLRQQNGSNYACVSRLDRAGLMILCLCA
ncbi:hypothetical protein FS749_008100 [Ceratobasidium sp. UAMH 11750]|nr:hypothetical protein FS749_008100 [Ceratobasidium sp. UAMH 11750]